MRMKNVSQLFKWIVEMLEGDDENDPMTLQEVVGKLTLRDMMERNEEEEDADQVQLMTLHSSKGLEFPFVYMVGMEEGFLPHQVSIDEDGVEEERRLAYVGITRAQRELTFTLCRERRQYGETVTPEPSRFLYELPQDDLEWETKRQPKTKEQKQEIGKRGIADIRAKLAAAKGKS
jgi:ATP-dependent DNA helicase Rep